MIDTILFLLKILLVTLPFLLFAFLNAKANLKREERSRQIHMPISALVICLICAPLISWIHSLVLMFVEAIPGWIASFGEWLGSLFDGAWEEIGVAIQKGAQWLADLFSSVDLTFWTAILVNAFIMLGYLFLKSIFIRFMKIFCKEGKKLFDRMSALVYYRDERKGVLYVKKHLYQGRTLAKSLYIISLFFAVAGIGATSMLYKSGLTASIYYPVFSIILIGEIYFCLDGNFEKKEASTLEGEADHSDRVSSYTGLRNVLRTSFSDKLLCENTTVNNKLVNFITNDELIATLENDDDLRVEAYGKFMRRKLSLGLDLDQNYLMSGLSLMKGKSILFNNPFYYDLIPYIFYPMNRAILRHKKVLVVLGRHAIENDICEWCKKGFASVNHIPSLWNIGILNDDVQDLDVGIITRSNVHNLKLHEANTNFFNDVEFVVLIEPSKLVATAQIGLNSIVRHCRRDKKQLVFCSTDKNCDGIIDSLSHIIMTSLEEVSATNRHSGTCSYMCWDADSDHLQHRLLPNLSRYLGVGTELSFAALKNQVSTTSWYGGDAFPVLDMHWIAKQYHYDLLTYASLPAEQSVMDEVFKVSPNMWEVTIQDNKYITVEDESFNMFEVKREFSTRARNQGFVNVISTEYLLKDYMAENDSIFDADSKAIPYITADYADTHRNIVYRLCLRLSSYEVNEKDIEQELSLLDISTDDIPSSIWDCICKCSASVSSLDTIENDSTLTFNIKGRDITFDKSVIRSKRTYSFKSGEMESFYFIDDERFINAFVGDLCNAEYISEDEVGEAQYLGVELRGHVFQKYLPGQFFTFGGKYYEMLRLSSDGKVVVRRAADHIDGRPQYRQVRNYTLHAAVDSNMMGDNKNIGGITVKRQYADISVDTPAYWSMKKYNDFESAKFVLINGVPTRSYHNKAILKIDFSGIAGVSREVINTLAHLMNETFRTLYADNLGMIAAVTACNILAPITYNISGDEDIVSENAIYIIEDSQLDVGLLISVERNLNRIFTIICDYIGWHTEMFQSSIYTNPEEEDAKVQDSEGSESAEDVENAEENSQPSEEEKNAKKPRHGIMKFFGAIGDFFKKIFCRKKKAEEKPSDADDEAAAPAAPEEAPKAEEMPPEGASENESSKETAATITTEAEETTQCVEFIQVTEEEKPLSKKEQKKLDKKRKKEEKALRRKKKKQGDESPNPPAAQEESDMNDEDESPIVEETLETENKSNLNTEVSPEERNRALDSLNDKARKPYHERAYLLYGGKEVPSCLDIAKTYEFLTCLGYGNGFLEQARHGTSEAERISNTFVPNRPGARYCDFCGAALLGTEYDVLQDGRERCIPCSRTIVKNEADLIKLYNEVIRNLKTFYGVVINKPVKIKMVNAKRLHNHLGKSFVPTGDFDPRILGVAIKDKSGYTILLENGSPRIKAVMTMVHELTHIWQYLNWNDKAIRDTYSKENELLIYEGMAKWAEIQYTYLINEPVVGKREDIITRFREDEYGRGYLMYVNKYPLSESTSFGGITPFNNTANPL